MTEGRFCFVPGGVSPGRTTQPKIFHWDAKGFSLVFSAPDSQVVSPGYAGAFTGDGRVQATVSIPAVREPPARPSNPHWY
jgi:hypothetical protein